MFPGGFNLAQAFVPRVPRTLGGKLFHRPVSLHVLFAAVSVITTVFTAFSSFGLVAVSIWYQLQLGNDTHFHLTKGTQTDCAPPRLVLSLQLSRIEMLSFGFGFATFSTNLIVVPIYWP
ncbi:hypothetical protein EDB89DRAFT_883145 [Lactarius sanguifluus]|nr:hypothetical protein EDB89DRAFT_883145 [Lactarius sanguifluus]